MHGSNAKNESECCWRSNFYFCIPPQLQLNHPIMSIKLPIFQKMTFTPEDCERTSVFPVTPTEPQNKLESMKKQFVALVHIDKVKKKKLQYVKFVKDKKYEKVAKANVPKGYQFKKVTQIVESPTIEDIKFKEMVAIYFTVVPKGWYHEGEWLNGNIRIKKKVPEESSVFYVHKLLDEIPLDQPLMDLSKADELYRQGCSFCVYNEATHSLDVYRHNSVTEAIELEKALTFSSDLDDRRIYFVSRTVPNLNNPWLKDWDWDRFLSTLAHQIFRKTRQYCIYLDRNGGFIDPSRDSISLDLNKLNMLRDGPAQLVQVLKTVWNLEKERSHLLKYVYNYITKIKKDWKTPEIEALFITE